MTQMILRSTIKEKHQESGSHRTVSRLKRAIFPHFKFGINGLAFITAIVISSLPLICNGVRIVINDTSYELPEPIIFEPSVIVYEQSVDVPLFEDMGSYSVIRLSDEKVSSIKKKKSVTANKDELYLLSLLVQAEAGYEDLDGKRRVADVVLNRVSNTKFPNTIREVIFAPGQFSTANIVKSMEKRQVKCQDESAMAANMELTSTTRLDTKSLYFAQFPITYKGLYQHGNHFFSY